MSSNSNYHTLLSFSTAPLQTVNVARANRGGPNGTVYVASGQCGSGGKTNHAGYLGVMDINFWDPVAQSIITSLGIGSTSFPIFVFYNAVMSNGDPSNLGNCCVLGYHNAAGSQTYVVGDFEGRNQTLFSGTADISALSHEIGRLSNGFTYHPQELAFFSWFFRESPSRGVNGWFSDNTFTTDAGAVCP